MYVVKKLRDTLHGINVPNIKDSLHQNMILRGGLKNASTTLPPRQVGLLDMVRYYLEWLITSLVVESLTFD